MVELVNYATGGNRHFDIISVEDGDVYLDVGAYDGEIALEATKRAKDLKLIIVEPNPTHIDAIDRNLRGHDFIYVPLAVGHIPKGHAYLYSFSASGAGGTLFIDTPLRTIKGYPITASYEINLTTIDNIIEETGLSPNFVKIDTDGFDQYVLRGFNNIQKGTKFHIEYHWNLPEVLYEMSVKNIQPITIEIWEDFNGQTGAIHAVKQ